MLVIYELNKNFFLNTLSLLVLILFLIFTLVFYKFFPIYYSYFLISSFVMTFLSAIILKKILKISFVLSLLFFFIIFFILSNSYKEIFYMIFFISFLNDTTAYIFGKTFKGPLIIPKISPNKTWSGTITSLSISSLVLFCFGYDIFISLIFSSTLFFGDIFFSFIKRKLSLKDFSKILSSHGGILDRLDSMYFIVPLFFTLNLL